MTLTRDEHEKVFEALQSEALRSARLVDDANHHLARLTPENSDTTEREVAALKVQLRVQQHMAACDVARAYYRTHLLPHTEAQAAGAAPVAPQQPDLASVGAAGNGSKSC